MTSPFRAASLPAPFALLLSFGLATALWPCPARATFHLNEITKVMAGIDGDATVQAVELKMLFNGENLVNGKVVRAYNAAGVLLGTLGSFSADLPAANAVAGNRILFATMKFRQRFGITPDLQFSPGIPVTTGQVSFEDPSGTCTVDAVAYGAVTTFLVGTTAAPPLPNGGATVLVRTVDNGTFPSCPLGTESGTQFVLTSGAATHPVTFTNNSGVSVTVSSTATGVETIPAVTAFRISPNPVRGTAVIESPGGGRINVYDLRGRLVRTILQSHTGPVRAGWNGTDDRGRPLASGVYFIRREGPGEPLVRRFVITR
ncbi:MAG TPA: T9SS type A sorting domain-containing protein [Candidatus Limnocylindrales bacterium]|nr:T9SS type A sorting domain-containing protein [Candidatus Limnocylindrales bacterium]